MSNIIKRSVICIILLIQVVSLSGCAAAWFLAGAGAAAAVTAVVIGEKDQPDMEYEEDIYLSEE